MMRMSKTPSHRIPAFLICGCLLVGCFGSLSRMGTHPIHGNLSGAGEVAVDNRDRMSEADGGVDAGLRDDAARDAELEESRMEDHDALGALIKSKLSDGRQDEAESEVGHTVDYAPGPSQVPSAKENLAIGGNQCLKRLRAEGVRFEAPDFETPLVETPVLLTAPIGEVTIRPHRQPAQPTQSIMDCHLALALVEVARQAHALGITEIDYYSVYRPLKQPQRTCPKKGHARKKCLEQKARYEQALRSGHASQHRFGRAIDIGWFKTADGRSIDVLAYFERRSGDDPCGYSPTSAEGRLLSDFVCGIHMNRVFNVMLTPNANEAHHNHFHFDLTPGATWYILK